ncbi:MAG: redoxin domain-containing protein [Bacteroidales bacterium]|nr:redoxin domain-containing protein [Bacteroidales bacterium]MDT8374216.1 redoxin domain-containing protein [Bacteroidales bacterium]
MAQINAQKTRSAKEAKGLEAGNVAPDFRAADASGNEFHLASALKSGPVVLIFYRGHWCPVCNKHLGVIQDSLQLITAKGATVIAVSPQKPEYLDKMADKTGASFSLLYDEGYAIADAYDVTFIPEKKELIIYNTVLSAQLKKSQSDESQRLPIPSTYIIDRDGLIAWRQFDPDYKNRSHVKNILEALELIGENEK